jgi:cellulose synthase/poly-beta-1,6-N-acetylglucosamine synthase-like glycosyltransferase
MQPTQHGVPTTPYLVSPYTPRERLALWLLAALWLAALAQFFAWWFDPAHVVSGTRFLIITLAVGWITLLPAYFVFFVLRARIANPAVPIPEGWRVAMVVTKVPSEPFLLVRETLEGMLRQRYPHDVWLADEDPAPETIAWCERHGVRISSRRGVAEYHRPDWPRRTRSKEGNLAYFYDHHGYQGYDFVVQLDADHVPEADYLEAMLRPFVDPEVGYVSAPSICDRNAGESWSARSRLYAEAQLHGIMQAGHSNGFAPLCIGSHYAVRTAALKESGGLGPELAEDHSTTLMMNVAGWRGVHALAAVARGYGPQTFADFAIQEFQWARSLTTILLEMAPRCWRSLSPGRRFQFVFSQLWYPLFSTSMLVFLLLPVIALFSTVAWVDVIYIEFLLRIVPVIACLLAISGFLVKLGHARPVNAKVVSWETALFVFVRWPWSLLGCLVAVHDRMRQRRAAFRITPKPGAARETVLPARFSLPYLLLALIAISPVFLVSSTGSAGGYVIFTALNALIYTGIFALVTKAPDANRVTADELALATADRR